MFEITSGKIAKAQKVCIYGPEGVGKSSFAAMFPEPLFIDTEGGTGGLDVRRLPKPSSWSMLASELDFVITDKPCKTIVIDTIDWTEQLCIDHILAKHGKGGIEDFGYGSGYVYEREEFCRFLNRTEDIIAAGINVVLTAHAQTRKFSQPDEIGEYDRWELKLGKKTGSQISPLVKEWADLLLFANYKTVTVAVDKEGKKFKAQGGTNRVMYTEHHACWDAKNRHGLAPELPFDFSAIAHIFETGGVVSGTDACTDSAAAVGEAAQNKSNGLMPDSRKTRCIEPSVHLRQETPCVYVSTEPDAVVGEAARFWFDGEDVYVTSGEKPQSSREVFEIPKEEYDKLCEIKKHIADTVTDDVPFTMSAPEKTEPAKLPDGIPKALYDLMAQNGVTEAEISKVVSLKGYFPDGTPIKNYPEDFINGVLIAAWEQVFAMIKQQREISNLPE